MTTELEDLQQKNRQLSRKVEELEEKQNFLNQVRVCVLFSFDFIQFSGFDE